MIFDRQTKKKYKKLLSPEKQVHIVLETQEEIDQLFAILNHTPIGRAIKIRTNSWENLRQNLPKTENYQQWHVRLCDRPLA